MKRKHRKFTNQFDLDVAIIKARKQAANEMRLARDHETEMKRWWNLANNPEIEAGKQEYYRGKGFEEKRLMERNLVRAKRLEDDALPKLIRAKAEFKTGVFEFSKDDKSVVLR